MSDPRVALVAAREAVLQRIAAMGDDLDAVAAAAVDSNLDDEHDPEGSTVAFEREQLAALRAAALTRLCELDAALARVAAGTYGTCERCGVGIGAARLAALPAARLCVQCARRPR